MRRLGALLLGLALAGPAVSEDAEDAEAILQQCISCHVLPDGQIDIVGLSALQSLPEVWPFLFEDPYDLDGDGIAGQMRFVSGGGTPVMAIYGEALAAGRFEDFALIAATAHDITIRDPSTLEYLLEGFEALSPAPANPFSSEAERMAFEARGCAGCHVTRTYVHDGVEVMPLSDFLLHDLGDGPTRTTPLWGCEGCVALTSDPHSAR